MYYKDLLGKCSDSDKISFANFHYFFLEPYHIDNRKSKLKVTRYAKKYLKNQLKTEYEFYEWIKKRLFRQFPVT